VVVVALGIPASLGFLVVLNCVWNSMMVFRYWMKSLAREAETLSHRARFRKSVTSTRSPSESLIRKLELVGWYSNYTDSETSSNYGRVPDSWASILIPIPENHHGIPERS